MGIRRNRSKARYWYNRAYRRGDDAAAHNMGILRRNDGKLRLALKWFQKAVGLGDAESNLDIGKCCLISELNPEKAITYLKQVCGSNSVSWAGAEEAKLLLKQAKGKLKRT